MKIRVPYLPLLLLGVISAFAVTPPETLNYQGAISVDGTPFEGPGLFKFVLKNGVGTSLWSNDGSSLAGSEPTASVSLTVTGGRYSVILGDTSLSGMTDTIPAGIFAENADISLCVWFNDGVNGFQELLPTQPLSSVGYAQSAATLDGFTTDPSTFKLSFGNSTTASGDGATAWGEGSIASELRATSWGINTTASGTNATAWGRVTTASGANATAFGRFSTASAQASTAGGQSGSAQGDYSFVHGDSVTAESLTEFVTGAFDTNYSPVGGTDTWDNLDRLFVIGNGTGIASRSDALVMLKSGDTTLNGDLTINGTVEATIGTTTLNAINISNLTNDIGFETTSQLASTAGAGGIGILDSGTNFTAEDLEGALAELAATILDPDGIVFGGTFGSGTIPETGAGTRMMWFPGEASFRAGQVNAAQWDAANVGNHSVAFGQNTTASGNWSFAGGNGATASGSNAFAFGWLATTASGDGSVVLGNGTATALESLAFGRGASAESESSFAVFGQTIDPVGAATAVNAVAIGRLASSSADDAIALGNASASGQESFAFGAQGASASAQYAIAGGSNTSASGIGSLAIGNNTTASGYTAVALGNTATAAGDYSFAVFGETTSGADFAVALGNSTASADYAASFGAATASGSGSFAFGFGLVEASGEYSFAGGSGGSTASGDHSFAFGNASSATGNYGIAMGQSASTNSGIVFGKNVSSTTGISIGDSNSAHDGVALGFGLEVNSGDSYATAIGIYNDPDEIADPLFMIGNGTTASARENVLTVDTSGNTVIKGTLRSDDIDSPFASLTVEGGTLETNGDLTIDGDAYKPGGGSWLASSDRRLKELKGEFTRGLDAIGEIHPVFYNYKQNNLKSLPSDVTFVGVVAQDLEGVVPESVSLDSDGYRVVDTNPVFYTMINAIKELKAENEALRTRIERLESASQEGMTSSY